VSAEVSEGKRTRAFEAGVGEVAKAEVEFGGKEVDADAGAGTEEGEANADGEATVDEEGAEGELTAGRSDDRGVDLFSEGKAVERAGDDAKENGVIKTGKLEIGAPGVP
jgi:hypothetical protein